MFRPKLYFQNLSQQNWWYTFNKSGATTGTVLWSAYVPMFYDSAPTLQAWVY